MLEQKLRHRVTLLVVHRDDDLADERATGTILLLARRVVVGWILVRNVRQVVQDAHGSDDLCSKIHRQSHARPVGDTVAYESKLTRVRFVDAHSQGPVLFVDRLLHVLGIDVFRAPSGQSFTQSSLQRTIDVGIKDVHVGGNWLASGTRVLNGRIYRCVSSHLAMLQESSNVRETLDAVVAAHVEPHLTVLRHQRFFWCSCSWLLLLLLLLWGRGRFGFRFFRLEQLDGCHVMKDLDDFHGIAFRLR
mmetsp:Transcript_25350/g.55555  ORF Transcript_25350/g.55555 Transcript_25350/m.55555 type:complete len:247 (+) Transcript_25350:3841-4581(+)